MRTQSQEILIKQRLKEQETLSKLYPKNIRVQLHPSSNSRLKDMDISAQSLIQLSISVSKKSTIGNIIQTIKKKLAIRESDAIFVFAHRTILHFNDVVGDVYSRFKDKLSSATLILEYTEYSVFGQ